MSCVDRIPECLFTFRVSAGVASFVSLVLLLFNVCKGRHWSELTALQKLVKYPIAVSLLLNVNLTLTMITPYGWLDWGGTISIQLAIFFLVTLIISFFHLQIGLSFGIAKKQPPIWFRRVTQVAELSYLLILLASTGLSTILQSTYMLMVLEFTRAVVIIVVMSISNLVSCRFISYVTNHSKRASNAGIQGVDLSPLKRSLLYVNSGMVLGILFSAYKGYDFMTSPKVLPYRDVAMEAWVGLPVAGILILMLLATVLLWSRKKKREITSGGKRGKSLLKRTAQSSTTESSSKDVPLQIQPVVIDAQFDTPSPDRQRVSAQDDDGSLLDRQNFPKYAYEEQVVVRVTGGHVNGTIGFKGGIAFADGMWFGIRVHPPGKGNHNGTVQGVFYFDAPPGMGLLVRPRAVECSILAVAVQ